MKYVYILNSLKEPGQRYFGVTSNLKQRFQSHNAGQCRHTSKYSPWRVETYIAFSDPKKAFEFEKYLKTGAGWAFSLKRLWSGVAKIGGDSAPLRPSLRSVLRGAHFAPLLKILWKFKLVWLATRSTLLLQGRSVEMRGIEPLTPSLQS